MTLAVETEDLSKSYTDWRGRQTRALQGASLKVEPGTIFGLMGRNGGGDPWRTDGNLFVGVIGLRKQP